MSQYRKLKLTSTQLFGAVLGITIAAYLLRGFGLPPFTSIPGGVYLLLVLLSVGTGILSLVLKTRRF